MSANVEDRIVQMQFDNRTFEHGVSTTLSTLQKLKNALSFSNKSDGLDKINPQELNNKLNSIGKAVQGIHGRFSAMGIAGAAAIGTIASQATRAAEHILASFTINPIKDGFQQYQQQINATQTILANTSASGSTLKDVTATLAVLNDYANKTIYNFSDMATNLGTFTSAGVKLGVASDAIQGLSNVAAAAGAGTQQAAGAMYQLSQALGRGKLQAQDWNSVVQAGMASSSFKTAILETGKALGTIKMPKTETIDQWIKKGGSFQDAMSKGQITSGVLIQTLQAMTGKLTDAQLAQKGYTAEQIKSIQAMAKTAEAAAVNVKTLKALKDNLQQGVGSAWAQIFKTIFGDLPTATKNMTILSTILNNIFVTPINDLNTLLQAWVKLGGLNDVIGGFIAGFKDMSAVIKPIKAAFREIFPPETAQGLVNLSLRFENFMKNMMAGKQTIDNIKRTFAGLFAIFDIAGHVIKGVFDLFQGLFNQVPKGNKGILDFTGNVGDLLVHFDRLLTTGGGLDAFFNKIYTAMSRPVAFLIEMKNAIIGLFVGFSSNGAQKVGDALNTVGHALSPIQAFAQKAKDALDHLFSGLGSIAQTLQPAFQAIGQAFSNFGQSIGQAISGNNFGGVLDVIQTGMLGGILLLVKKFFSKGISVDLGGGFLKSIKESLGGVTGSLHAMQTQLKAKALLEIAGALALLTASVAVLATIDSKKIADSLKALAVGFGELLGGLSVLSRINGTLKLPILAASLVIISGAILTLTGAVKILSTMSWDQLKRGLSSVGILLATVSASAVVLSKGSSGLVTAGIGINAIAIAMNILYFAVKDFASLSWTQLGKGLVAVAGLLTGIALAMKLMPPGMAAQGLGILAIAGAMNLLYLAVKDFAGLNWTQMAKGLAGVAGSLVAIAAGMRLMPKGIGLQAAGLIVVAGALLLLAKAAKSFAGMSWQEIGKGLTGFAGSLAVLVVALNTLEGSILGATALGVVALSMGQLEKVLVAFSTLKWGEIGKGIAGIAIALGTLIAAGYAADGAALGLLALGAATVGIGAGLALAGAGINLLAKGLGVLAKSGSAGIKVLLQAISQFIAKIPAIATAFALGLVNILKIIGKNGPTIAKAFGAIIIAISTAIVKSMPSVVKAITAIIQGLIQALRKNAPSIIAEGLRLLEELLGGIQHNIGKVTTQVAAIIVNFLNALAKRIPSIVAAGVRVLTSFLGAIADHIGEVITAGGNIIIKFVVGMGSQFGRIASATGTAIAHFIDGISNAADQIVNAGANLIINFVTGLSKKMVDVVDAAGAAILNFLVGLDDAINKYEPQIISETIKIGEDIIKGIVKGIGNKIGGVFSSLKNGLSRGLHDINPLNWGSPAKCLGEPIMDNLIDGIKSNTPRVTATLKDHLTDSLKNVSKTIGKLPNPLDGIIDTAPKIKPVLDLSDVQNGAKQLAALTASSVIPITAAASYVQAKNLSTAVAVAKQNQAVSDVKTATPTPSVTFEQNNYSPEALSTLDIYRQTNNGIGKVKTALGLPA